LKETELSKKSNIPVSAAKYVITTNGRDGGSETCTKHNRQSSINQEVSSESHYLQDNNHHSRLHSDLFSDKEGGDRGWLHGHQQHLHHSGLLSPREIVEQNTVGHKTVSSLRVEQVLEQEYVASVEMQAVLEN